MNPDPEPSAEGVSKCIPAEKKRATSKIGAARSPKETRKKRHQLEVDYSLGRVASRLSRREGLQASTAWGCGVPKDPTNRCFGNARVTPQSCHQGEP